MNAIETKVLELIGEDPDSPDVFVDTDAGMAPIRDSINDAIEEITMLTGARQEKYQLPLRKEQTFYRIILNNGQLGWVTDAWSVNQRYRLEQTDLTKLSYFDPRWLTTNAEPRAYMQVGQDVIGVWPKPSTDSNVIEFTMVIIPERYTSDLDRVMLRSDYEYAAIHYAVAEYWASRGDANEASTHFQMYLDALGLREKYQFGHDTTYRLSTQKEPWPKDTA